MSRFLLTKTSAPIQDVLWGTFYRDTDERVGNYSITDEIVPRIRAQTGAIHKILVAALRMRLAGESRSIGLNAANRPTPGNPEHILAVDFEDLLSDYPATPVAMFDNALLNLSRLAKFPGDAIQLDEITSQLLYAETDEQQRWMRRQLAKAGYILEADDGTMSNPASLTIESAGWQQISLLQRKSSGGKTEAFVAMSFSDAMKPIYEGAIRPTIEVDGRIKAVRVDGIQHNNKICDEIVAAIRRAKFVVADFTENKAGVYFEAGFALGLGIPVIYIVKDSAEGLHFDTRQYNHIVYTSVDELKVLLRARISATVVG